MKSFKPTCKYIGIKYNLIMHLRIFDMVVKLLGNIDRNCIPVNEKELQCEVNSFFVESKHVTVCVDVI